MLMLVCLAAEEHDDENMSDVDFESGDDFAGLSSDDEAPELEDTEMPVSKKSKKN